MANAPDRSGLAVPCDCTEASNGVAAGDCVSGGEPGTAGLRAPRTEAAARKPEAMAWTFLQACIVLQHGHAGTARFHWPQRLQSECGHTHPFHGSCPRHHLYRHGLCFVCGGCPCHYFHRHSFQCLHWAAAARLHFRTRSVDRHLPRASKVSRFCSSFLLWHWAARSSWDIPRFQAKFHVLLWHWAARPSWHIPWFQAEFHGQQAWPRGSKGM